MESTEQGILWTRLQAVLKDRTCSKAGKLTFELNQRLLACQVPHAVVAEARRRGNALAALKEWMSDRRARKPTDSSSGVHLLSMGKSDSDSVAALLQEMMRDVILPAPGNTVLIRPSELDAACSAAASRLRRHVGIRIPTAWVGVTVLARAASKTRPLEVKELHIWQFERDLHGSSQFPMCLQIRIAVRAAGHAALRLHEDQRLLTESAVVFEAMRLFLAERQPLPWVLQVCKLLTFKSLVHAREAECLEIIAQCWDNLGKWTDGVEKQQALLKLLASPRPSLDNLAVARQQWLIADVAKNELLRNPVRTAIAARWKSAIATDNPTGLVPWLQIALPGVAKSVAAELATRAATSYKALEWLKVGKEVCWPVEIRKEFVAACKGHFATSTVAIAPLVDALRLLDVNQTVVAAVSCVPEQSTADRTFQQPFWTALLDNPASPTAVGQLLRWMQRELSVPQPEPIVSAWSELIAALRSP